MEMREVFRRTEKRGGTFLYKTNLSFSEVLVISLVYDITVFPFQDLLLDVNNEGKLFLLSFYEGLQRVALFTEERRMYMNVCESEKAELAEQEIILSLQNMGISLVNNTTSQEVAFIGITR